jgi:hypothetical protein
VFIVSDLKFFVTVFYVLVGMYHRLDVNLYCILIYFPASMICGLGSLYPIFTLVFLRSVFILLVSHCLMN